MKKHILPLKSQALGNFFSLNIILLLSYQKLLGSYPNNFLQESQKDT